MEDPVSEKHYLSDKQGGLLTKWLTAKEGLAALHTEEVTNKQMAQSNKGKERREGKPTVEQANQLGGLCIVILDMTNRMENS